MSPISGSHRLAAFPGGCVVSAVVSSVMDKLRYRDDHYQLEDSRWQAQICPEEYVGDSLTEAGLLPAPGDGVFASEEEAIAYMV